MLLVRVGVDANTSGVAARRNDRIGEALRETFVTFDTMILCACLTLKLLSLLTLRFTSLSLLGSLGP